MRLLGFRLDPQSAGRERRGHALQKVRSRRIRAAGGRCNAAAALASRSCSTSRRLDDYEATLLLCVNVATTENTDAHEWEVALPPPGRANPATIQSVTTDAQLPLTTRQATVRSRTQMPIPSLAAGLRRRSGPPARFGRQESARSRAARSVGAPLEARALPAARQRAQRIRLGLAAGRIPPSSAREVLEVLGAFDEGFRLYGEDIDLAYRAAKTGWER
jgi:hypothetical protein